MIDRFEKLSYAVSELHNYLNKLTKDEMSAYGLKGSHATYLFALMKYEDGITGSELSEICFRNKADVSRAMVCFEEKGLIVRKGGSSKSYRAHICLTAEGRRVAKSVSDRALVVINRIGEGISDQDRKVCYKTLDLIAQNMRDTIDFDKDSDIE